MAKSQSSNVSDVQAQLSSAPTQDDLLKQADHKISNFENEIKQKVNHLQADMEQAVQTISSNFNSKMEDYEQLARTRLQDFEHFLADYSPN